jgi:hypothetical protein
MLRVRFSEKEKQLIVSKSEQKNYFELLDTQAIEIFLPDKYQYKIVDESELADICIIGIQHTDNSLLRSNEYNIFLSVENFSVGRTHYKHWNKFGRSKNSLISTYIYNDVPHPVENIIPAVYSRVKYFNLIYPQYESIRSSIQFENKKFCLFTSRNGLNTNKNTVINQLSQLGHIDFLDKYDNILKSKSCYNSPELIQIYSQYKFIICFENSKTDGYVTEKVFNVFLSGSVPIYDGAPNIVDYIVPGSFIQYDANIVKKITMLANNPVLYNAIINKDKTKELEYSISDMQFNYQLEKKIVKSKCFIGGCTKNCSKHIEKVFENIKKIGSLFDEYHVIMAYDNSDDNTLELLNEQKNIIINMDILINSNPTTHIRTQNIANARNAILNKIKSSYTSEWKYFIMIDCDDVCEYDVDESILGQYLTRYDWDSLSFNRKCYYDTWALSFDPYIFSCWNWPNAREVIDTMNSNLEKKLNSLNKNDLFPCYSAFNGFAIYRTSKFLNCTYEWETPIDLISKEQMERNINATGTIPFIRQNNDDCEHRSFHLQAIIKNQAKIMISPLCLFDN